MKRARAAPYQGLCLALCLVAAAPAAAWGPQGHRTVGAIADRLLTPRARAEVERILADDRDKYGNPSGRTSLESVSVWADEIRGTAASRPAWHYDNEPVCGVVPRARYCPGEQCVSGVLPRLVGQLADARTPAVQRDEALKWVVHLVGDIHQPLHVADNVDHGGNDVQVALAGVRTRGHETLHKAWDTELVRLALHARGRGQPPAAIDALAREAAATLADAGESDIPGWASESHHLARNVAYAYTGFACDRAAPGIVILDAAYVDEAVDIVRLRVLLAGARLAALVNRALDPAAGTPPGRSR